MAKVTKQQVISALCADDYAMAKKLGAAAIPHLKSIVKTDDWGLVAKATYLAGLLDEDASAEIIDTVARSRKPTLRAVAAAAAGHLSKDRAEPILERLLKSRIVGIRKCAIRAVGSAGTEILRRRIAQISKSDAEKELQRLARATLRSSKSSRSGPAVSDKQE